MPFAQYPSQASLRRTRSIPANILYSTKIDEDQRVRPEVARQYALAAANRAFQLAQSPKAGVPAKVEAPTVPAAMPQRHTVQSTDETLVNDEEPLTIRRTGRGTPRDTRSALGAVDSAPASDSQPIVGIHSDGAAGPLPANRTVTGQSSFHKLSKQKSTFSLRKSASPGKLSLPGTIGRETPTLRNSTRRSPGKSSFPTGLSPGRAPPTAGELLQRLPNSYQTTYNQDVAVQIARDEFLRQIHQQNENSVQSAIVKSDRSKIAKHFRHTLRRASKAIEDPATNTTESSEIENTETRARGRSFSQGFKATFRRIFRGSSSRGFPAQQVDATRKHYESLQDEDDAPNDPIRYPVIPAPDPEMVARLSLRQSNDTFIPSPSTIRHMSSQPPSIRGMRSSESLRTGSRVTSWANSTTSKGTHLTNAPDLQAHDQARLSVIQEHAPPRPSSSARRHLGHQSSRASSVEPMHSLRDIHGVDTEKMAREIRENIRRKCDAAGAESYHDSAGSKPRKHVSSSHQHAALYNYRPPLRRLTLDSDEEGSPPLQLSVRKRRGITFPSSDDDDIFEPSVPRLRGQNKRSLHHKLSLQDIANLNEGHIPSRRQSLRESRSTFFPGKGQYPNYELSPYHKATQASFEKDSSEGQSVRDVTPVDSQESASTYSRRTSGTPYVTTLFDRVEQQEDHGVAYVEERPINHYRSLVGRSRGVSGAGSHRSSGSWHGWVTSELSKLEGSAEYSTDFNLPQDQPGLKGVGHVRESAGDDGEAGGSDKGTMRTASGSRPALDAVRFISGLRLPKRTTSSESKENTSRRGSFNIREDSDVSSLKSRLRVMLPGLRGSTDASDRPSSCAPLLTHKTSEPALKLPTVPESPMTPFSKFMANEARDDGGSPLDGYHLRERAATSSNFHQSSERDARLRRMQSSILVNNRSGRHGPDQYPWLQRYRDSHFYEELSPANRENKPLVYGAVPHKNQENEPRPYHGSMEDDPFPDPVPYRRRVERSSSGEPAFI